MVGAPSPSEWVPRWGVLGGDFLRLRLALGFVGGLRALSYNGWDLTFDDAPEMNVPTMIGFALNLLELPAIVIAIELGWGQSGVTHGPPWDRAWEIFAISVVPLPISAAIGEELWLGRRR